VLHESGGLQHLEENLNYDVDDLMRVWPKRFPTVEIATPYANNPVKLANKVYGGRYGNTQPGDGWAYRGRSLIQVTFKANYSWLGDLMGQDLTVNPDLLAQPRYALEATVLWWEGKVPDSLLGDPEKVTQRVNGGLIGLAHRVKMTNLAGKALA
jgi:putative chitinase